MSLPELSTNQEEEVFVFPLSFAQQRLWFLHQMDPASAAYNMPVAFRLAGELDAAAVEWALNEILRRHEILRTTFAVLDQNPVQLIGAVRTLTLNLIDLTSLPAPATEPETEKLIKEETQRPFDLAQGPLFRAMLIRLQAEDHLLLLTMHHIVSDGWSQSILIGELETLYEARIAGRSSPLPDLSIQYADFAEWQREWLRGEVLERQMNYWREQLAGAPQSLELPADRPRPPLQSFNGARESFMLSRGLSAQLLELSRREGATLFMTLFAAFNVLLYRYTGQTDIVLGTPVANRNREELERLIGFFVNTLVLRTDLSGDPAFPQLLSRVREVALGAYAHQDLPFEMLVEELRPGRDPSRNPLFQVMFALQNTPEPVSAQSKLVISPVEVKSTRAQFDLVLDVNESNGEIDLTLIYNTDLFDAGTIRLMVDHFRILLEGVAAQPDRNISALPLLSPAESHQLLIEWNDTQREFSGELFAHRLFEAQTERTPEAIALVFEDEQVSYRELNRRANRLAHYLIDLGVGPESLVGLLLERSIEMIVALLGILKAGGAYVPLDPASPPARLSYLLDDALISLLLTDTRSSSHLPAHHAQAVFLDAVDDVLSRQLDRNPSCRTTPDNAAYVIYTSGSTGSPKGVVIAHRSLCTRIASMVEGLAVHGESCVLQFASLGFDVSVKEIFTALSTGARLCLISRETLLSGRGLVELAQKQNVTVATLPPSLLAFMSPEDWPAIETMVSAGERCPAEVAARWARCPRFINGYGPTETTIGATRYQCDGTHGGEPPIGRPLDNTRIYLLDQQLNPVPVGAAGELHIAGAGVARGYLHRPELTAEKFIPDPFSVEPGSRLYKTGDMGRYVAGGNIKFLGRRDEQLKIRGLRIEPGEIASVLKGHAAVSDAVVLADEDRLVAYVVSKPRMEVTAEELRVFSRQELPEHMTPSLFVLLDELPLTTNGKLDRAALIARAKTQAEPVGTRVAARDLLESQLADIWEELLHVEPDVRDNFFDLGGHSLLVMRLLARVEQIAGKRLDVAALFQAPTIEALAMLLRREANAVEQSPLVAIQPQGSLSPVFFVHPAGGSVFNYFALARRLGVERPFYGLQATPVADEESVVSQMAKRYVEAVRAVTPEGPYLLGGWSAGGVVAYEMARQLQASGAKVALVALLDSVAPGDLVTTDDAARVAGFALTLGVSMDQLAAAPAEVLRSGIQEQLQWVLEQAHRGQLVPPDVSVANLREWFDRYLADVKAIDNYRPAATPVPLLLLRATDAGEVVKTTGWSLLSSDLGVREVPGDHLTMMREPNVSVIAEILRERFAHFA